MAYERNFGNVTYNVLFNPPLYLVATIDAADLPGGVAADLHRQRGTVRRRRRRDQDHPGGQPATRRSEHQDRLVAHLRRVGHQRTVRRAADRVDRIQRLERTGSLRPGRPQQGGARRWSTKASARPHRRPNTQYTAFNTRGNRGRSQYHSVVFSADARQLRRHGAGAHVEVHAEQCQGQPERHVQRRRQQRLLQPRVTWIRSIRCSTTATPGSTSGTASRSARSGTCRWAAPTRGPAAGR